MITRKFSELEKLEALTNETNIVVEEEGKLKRVSPGKIGTVKSVNGIAPDENGNVSIDLEEMVVKMISSTGAVQFASEDGESLFVDNNNKIFTL